MDAGVSLIYMVLYYNYYITFLSAMQYYDNVKNDGFLCQGILMFDKIQLLAADTAITRLIMIEIYIQQSTDTVGRVWYNIFVASRIAR